MAGVDNLAALPPPLAIWDVHMDRWLDERFHERSQWAQDHFPRRAEDVYRAEFYLLDTAFAVLYRWAENDIGNRFLDPETGKPAKLPPVALVLNELPPERLR